MMVSNGGVEPAGVTMDRVPHPGHDRGLRVPGVRIPPEALSVLGLGIQMYLGGLGKSKNLILDAGEIGLDVCTGSVRRQ